VQAMPLLRWLVVGFSAAEIEVREHVSPCGICGGQSGTGTDFFPIYLVFPVNIIPPLLSMLIYYLGDKQYAL
jgi:hypothetical protein